MSTYEHPVELEAVRPTVNRVIEHLASERGKNPAMAYHYRMAVRAMLDLGTADSARWLYRLWVDEDSSSYYLKVWDEMVTLSNPCALLVRKWLYKEDEGYYEPCVVLYFPHGDDYETRYGFSDLLSVDVPSDWWEDI